MFLCSFWFNFELIFQHFRWLSVQCRGNISRSFSYEGTFLWAISKSCFNQGFEPTARIFFELILAYFSNSYSRFTIVIFIVNLRGARISESHIWCKVDDFWLNPRRRVSTMRPALGLPHSDLKRRGPHLLVPVFWAQRAPKIFLEIQTRKKMAFAIEMFSW